MVYILLAPGFEEIEALAPADLMRRAGLEVALVSVTGEAQVPGSHNISVTADCTLDQVEPGKCRLLMLPGGMGGVNGIKASAAALKLVETIHGQGKPVAAICAAPSVLGGLGFLQGKKATCYPGFEDKLIGAQYTKQGVVTDGLITTARGLGYALDLGIELAGLLVGRDTAATVKAAIQYDQC